MQIFPVCGQEALILAFIFTICVDLKAWGNNSLSAPLSKIRKPRQRAVIDLLEIISWMTTKKDMESCIHDSGWRPHTLTHTNSQGCRKAVKNFPCQSSHCMRTEPSPPEGRYKSSPAFGSGCHWDMPRPRDEDSLTAWKLPSSYLFIQFELSLPVLILIWFASSCLKYL